MKHYFYTFVLATLLGCGSSDASKGYRILAEEEGDFNKLSLYIELPKEKNKAELGQIAKQLYRDRKDYDKVWMFYFLPGMERSNGAWATTHFTPELEVVIIGNTAEQKENITADTDIPDEFSIKGQWYEAQVTRMGFKLLEKDDKTYMRITMSNGVDIDKEVKEKTVKGMRRLDDVEANGHGEYYVLEKDGTLGLYGQNGRYAVAIPVKK